MVPLSLFELLDSREGGQVQYTKTFEGVGHSGYQRRHAQFRYGAYNHPFMYTSIYHGVSQLTALSRAVELVVLATHGMASYARLYCVYSILAL